MGGGYSVIGLSQWLYHGSSFGAKGYARASKAGNWNLDVDIACARGRTYIITGANAGLGLECARSLARAGADVHMLCRNHERGEAAVASILSDCGASASNVHLHVVDVSDVTAVKAFAGRWISTGAPLDALINNAGVLLKDRTESAQGVEAGWATMMVQTYLLTGLLMPALAASSAKPARVVNVSSGGQYTVRLDMKDPMAMSSPRRYDGTQQYAHAKRAQVMLTEMIADRLRGSGVIVNSMHPGWSLTPGVATSIPDFAERNKGDLRTPAQGADTITWLAASDAPAAVASSGEFFFDRHVAVKSYTGSGTTSDKADYTRLWEMCEKLCGWKWGEPLASADVSRPTSAAGGTA